MPRIYQLPPGVVAQIAAGEVIERPASVVKELLENSIDAGSTRVDIDLEAGGTELIRVVDDGCGIIPDDLPLAFASHATSKLKDADDLFRIGTMGFRGEALSSIAGVAKVALQSRPHDQDSGAEIRIDDGHISPPRPWNGSGGTRIEVRHLFYNVPVRKKFLKSHATEFGHVCEIVTRLALANPSLHLVLRHNGKLIHEIPATAGLLDRIGLFFTQPVRDALFEIDSGPGLTRLTGFIADPKCDRGTAKLQYLFINGRWFRDRSLAHALQESYRGLLMTGRYAIGFLFLSIPPDQVDVNVHPTKAEVRFRENSLMYSLVRSTVKSRLLRENLVPRLEWRASSEPSEGASQPQAVSPPWGLAPPPSPTPALFDLGATRPSAPEPWGSSAPPAPPTTTPTLSPPPVYAGLGGFSGFNEPTPPTPPTERGEETPTPPDAPTPPPSPALPPEAPAPLREPQIHSIGSAFQLHDSYLVLETREGMLVIDQHALHERILFEQLRRRVREGKLEVQRLLIPEPMELPAEQAALVLEAAESLLELGFEVSDFGGNTVLLSSYPTLLGRKPPHVIFQGAIDYLIGNERPPTREALLHHLMATMACKAAVKAGDPLTREEITHLLHLRDLAEDSHHCPHGRPTSLLFSRSELDKQFRRT